MLFRSDFRDGTIQTAFTGPDMLRSECSNVFSCVEVGQSIEQMPVKSLHFLWALVSA